MNDLTDPLVTVDHMRKAKLCSRGGRQWATRHGLDYMRFISRGYPASVLEATGDAFGKLVADIARKEAAGEEED